MFGLGSNSTQTSLASEETLSPVNSWKIASTQAPTCSSKIPSIRIDTSGGPSKGGKLTPIVEQTPSLRSHQSSESDLKSRRSALLAPPGSLGLRPNDEADIRAKAVSRGSRIQLLVKKVKSNVKYPLSRMLKPRHWIRFRSRANCKVVEGRSETPPRERAKPSLSSDRRTIVSEVLEIHKPQIEHVPKNSDNTAYEHGRDHSERNQETDKRQKIHRIRRETTLHRQALRNSQCLCTQTCYCIHGREMPMNSNVAPRISMDTDSIIARPPGSISVSSLSSLPSTATMPLNQSNNEDLFRNMGNQFPPQSLPELPYHQVQAFQSVFF
ncbi:MAG: hypothetical protein M1834_006057 [Cirrosporium novae-zelandiae]|nr:MAG: hypothetical protein M1834_006057 [Cirrosporium novae-zelandiae]